MVEQQDAKSGRVRRRTRAPRTTQHADYVDPFAFTDFLNTALEVTRRPFDVMLEARARDLALDRPLAVIGVSPRPTNLGRAITTNLISHHYTGRISLVGPRGGYVYGHLVRRTLEKFQLIKSTENTMF